MNMAGDLGTCYYPSWTSVSYWSFCTWSTCPSFQTCFQFCDVVVSRKVICEFTPRTAEHYLAFFQDTLPSTALVLVQCLLQFGRMHIILDMHRVQLPKLVHSRYFISAMKWNYCTFQKLILTASSLKKSTYISHILKEQISCYIFASIYCTWRSSNCNPSYIPDWKCSD